MSLVTKKFDQIWEDLKDEFSYSTIKECSYDDENDVHLIDFELDKVVFNFDQISETWAQKRLGCRKPKSIDTIYIDDGKLHLIEFKNTSRVDHRDVKAKIHDSLALLNYFYEFEQSDFNRIEIILVRKEKPKSSKAVMRKHANYKSESNCPPSLEFLQKVYRVNISKITNDDFLQYIQ